MRKERTPVTPTPQRFAWTDYAVVATYTEADGIRNTLKNEYKKIRLQRNGFHVKIGAALNCGIDDIVEVNTKIEKGGNE